MEGPLYETPPELPQDYEVFVSSKKTDTSAHNPAKPQDYEVFISNKKRKLATDAFAQHVVPQDYDVLVHTKKKVALLPPTSTRKVDHEPNYYEEFAGDERPGAAYMQATFINKTDPTVPQDYEMLANVKTASTPVGVEPTPKAKEPSTASKKFLVIGAVVAICLAILLAAGSLGMATMAFLKATAIPTSQFQSDIAASGTTQAEMANLITELKQDLNNTQSQLIEVMSMASNLSDLFLATPGQPGPPGLQGLTGPKGDQGLMGNMGEPGMDGQPGSKGDVGPPGSTGQPGSKGDVGPPGQPGAEGTQGLKGSKGEKGMPGSNGNSGPQGPPGVDGSNGEMGDKGMRGSKGSRGDEGEKGQKGKKGSPGGNK